MAIDSRAKEAIEYLDRLIVDQQKAMLGGKAVSSNPEQTAANYQAGVLVNQSMIRLRKAIAEIFTKKAEGDEDDGE